MASIHLLNVRIIHGVIPLWSPEINGGEPLWPMAESQMGLDPVGLLSWSLGKLLGWSSVYSFQIAVLLWLYVFTLGAYACARQISPKKSVASLVLILCFVGPLSWALPKQTQGFLLPFRYSPWVVYGLIRYARNPQWRTAVILSILAVLSLAGYQSGYAAVFYLSLVVTFLIFGVGGRAQFLRGIGRHGALFVALFLWGASPTLIVGLKLLSLAPVAREVTPGMIYNREAMSWLRDHAHPNSDGSHGTTFLGYLFQLFILVGLFSLVLQAKNRSAGWRLTASFFATAVILIFVAERSGISLGLRNWGFLVTPGLLCLILVGVWGFDRVLENVPRRIAAWLSVALPLLVLSETLTNYYRYQQYGMLLTEGFRNSTPPMKVPVPEWQDRKIWEFDLYRKHRHLFYQGPSHFGGNYAYMVPEIPHHPPRAEGVTSATHQIRLPRYHRLVSDPFLKEHPRLLREILGVDLPVLRIVRNPKEARSVAEALEKLSSFKDLGKEAVIEAAYPVFAGSLTPPSLTVTSFGTNHLSVHAEGARGGVLVYADNYDEDWRATANGKELKISPVNVSNKGVVVPDSSSDIHFLYRPTSYLIAFWARNLFWLASIVFGIAYVRKVRSA